MTLLPPSIEQHVHLLTNPTLLRWRADGWGREDLLPGDQQRLRWERRLRDEAVSSVGQTFPGMPLEQLDRLLRLPEHPQPAVELGAVGRALDVLADRYVCIEKGIPVARHRLLDEFQSVKLRIVVEHLACWKVARILADQSLSGDPTEGLSLEWPAGLGVQHHNLAIRLSVPLVENHVHLGGVLGTLDLWIDILDSRSRRPRLRQMRGSMGQLGDETLGPLLVRRLERARVLRDLVEVLAGEPHSSPPPVFWSETARERLDDEIRLERLLGLTEMERGSRASYAAIAFADCRPIPYLLSPTRERFRQEADRGASANLLLERSLLVRSFCALLSSDRKDRWLGSLLTIYLVSQNLFHQAVTRQGDRIGLGHFLQWYDAAARDPSPRQDRRRQVRVLERVSRGGFDRVEGRVTPDPKQIRSWIAAFRKASFWQAEGAELGKDFGLVCHFIKESDPRLTDREDLSRNRVESSVSRLRHRALRDKIRHQSYQLEHLRSIVAEAAVAVVGIDAARGEGDAPPEVFAPAFRFLRRQLPEGGARGKPCGEGRHQVPPLRATFHVGESFDHPLTGLRRIHEAMLFLNLRPGDRLGHGLALGLDPGAWLEACGASPSTCREQLFDDLVWMVWMLRRLGEQKLVSTRMLERIQGLRDTLYGDLFVPSHTSILDLGTAWQSRWMDPEDVFGILHAFGWENGVPPEGERSERDQRLAGNLRSCRRIGRCKLRWKKRGCEEDLCTACEQGAWKRSPAVIDVAFSRRRRKWRLATVDLDWLFSGDVARATLRYLWCYHFDPLYFQRGQVSVEWPEDLEWEPAFRVLQKAVVREVEKRVLTVEACPTSNQGIGGIRDLGQHPLFRLRGPDPGGERSDAGASVLIGTDDPGIFATSLPGEYAAVAQAAEKRGAGDEQILEWIDRLKRASEEATFLRSRGMRLESPIPADWPPAAAFHPHWREQAWRRFALAPEQQQRGDHLLRRLRRLLFSEP